ncbi:MAG TPA: carboxypeptidase regulatory-like domain-containing protein, partial [Bacteroidales bacterium]
MSGLLSVVAINSFGAARFYEITGNVSAKETNEPVVYALVALGSKSDSSIVMTTYTDSLGNYQLANVKDGQYYILAQMIGYEKVNEPIVLDTTKNNIRKDFQLSIKETKEVNVVAKRPFIESKSDRLVMNMDAQLASVGES